MTKSHPSFPIKSKSARFYSEREPSRRSHTVRKIKRIARRLEHASRQKVSYGIFKSVFLLKNHGRPLLFADNVFSNNYNRAE